jgi:glycerol-3-phosphate dehydrogenase (NAD(P)+)
MSKKELVAVLGAGNMGTAIAQVVALNGYKVNLWNHSGDLEPLKQIKEKKENINYLAGVKLSKNINPEPDIRQAVFEAGVVFITVPSSFIKSVVKQAAAYINQRAICVDVSKGMDEKSLGLIVDILKSILPKNKIATISGPAIAGQMARGNFTAMNVASSNARAVRIVKKVLENKNLKLIPSGDIVGVEVAGSFKNVYAIAMGICDGFSIPTNTKAVLFVAALKEMGLLVKKMGGRLETVYGLAGLGDLIGTGLADASRNRRLGEFLANGLSLSKATAKVGQVTEGVVASRVLNSLSKKYKLKIPFADAIYKIVHGKTSAKIEMENFLKNLK